MIRARLLRRLPALALMGITLTACTRAVAPDDYFPLQPGHEWRYRVDVEGAPRPPAGLRVHEVRTLRPIKVDGVDGKVFRRFDTLGNEYHFTRSDTGVERIGLRNATELEAQRDVPARPVLPTPPKVGSTWQVSTHPFALRRTVPLGGYLSSQYSIALTMMIEATNDVVTTPAGRFENCLRVVGEGSIELYGDARQGFITVPITQTEWYAPGVGLVKLLREEPLEAEIFEGGSIQYELIGYR
ncbi:MAG: hypothetical protein AAGA68_25020 [Pseudomonadota bacterium]